MLEADVQLLEGLRDAIHSPAFPLYLGRRSCPPAGRIPLKMFDGSLEEALSSSSWRASDKYRREQPREVHLLWSRDANEGEQRDETVRDVPVSFDPTHREYGLRDVVHGWTKLQNPDGRDTSLHDEFLLLGGDA